METAEAVTLHDDLLAQMPAGARHDADICPICVDKAAQVAATPRIPPVSDGPGESDHQSSHMNTKGGTSNPMSDMTRETHDALLEKAVKDAVSTTEAALARTIQENAELTTKVEQLEADKAQLETDKATLASDNERINHELDTAQVTLKAATDEVATLKADIAAKDEAAAKAEVASKRTEQVKNLKLFGDEYVAEKASSWADLADEAWAERLDEWAKLKPAVEGTSTKTDTASAMTGTSEDLTKDPKTDTSSNNKPSARRAALGLS